MALIKIEEGFSHAPDEKGRHLISSQETGLRVLHHEKHERRIHRSPFGESGGRTLGGGRWKNYLTLTCTK